MDEPRQDQDETANAAKRLGRRATLKMLGLAVTGAAAAGTAAIEASVAPQSSTPAPKPQAPVRGRGRAWSLRPLAAGTAPRHFSAAEFAALAAAVEVILPDTDTPGARTAGVHWYLDDAAGSDAAMASRMSAGLRRLDARAQAMHGRAFAALEPGDQAAVLSTYEDGAGGTVKLDAAAQPRVTGASPETAAVTPDDRSFFALIKARTIDAYYKSEMGQIGELEWVGHEFHDEFPGACTHADPLVHPRARWPRSRA
jgi:hypothetical protein